MFSCRESEELGVAGAREQEAEERKARRTHTSQGPGGLSKATGLQSEGLSPWKLLRRGGI